MRSARECSYKGLKLAQLLGRLGVCLTLASGSGLLAPSWWNQPEVVSMLVISLGRHHRPSPPKLVGRVWTLPSVVLHASQSGAFRSAGGSVAPAPQAPK